MSKKNIRVKETVTVRMAKQFLDSRRNGDTQGANHRNISRRHVDELADAMLYNRWQYNGESLKFDIDGHLIDGQHRLVACIKAGKSFVSDVVFGLDPNSYLTIDVKAKGRSGGDILKITGEKNTNCLAAALVWHIAYTRKCISSHGKTWVFTPDSKEILAELAQHLIIKDSVVIARKCSHLAGPGSLSFLHYIFQCRDKTLADDFFVKLATGENLSSGHPVLYIRQMLLEEKIHNKAKMPMGEKIACIIKGWNLLRCGKRATSRNSFKWISAGNRAEDFPVAK